MKKIKTFEDACKALGITFNPNSDLTPDELAYQKLKIIAKALNEGWQPNWNNWDELKYYPWFKMGDNNAAPGVGFSYDGYHCGRTYSHVGSRLCFKSSELAIYAGETFTDLYKQYFLIK